MRSRILSLCILCPLACASVRQTEIAPLVAEGKASELAAVAKHRGERLRVTGLVVSSGLRSVNQTVVKHGPEVFPGAPSQSVASTQSVQHPYLYVADPNDRAKGALLLCYFRPEQLDVVALIVPGTRVELTGMFQGYDQGATLVVLNTCDVE
ncbi:MAG: hypothetical protein IT377_33660 [Polyangiaceae bacterium]|nr:hypothetical protein [Polyangiaceae bacterium]